MRLKLPINPLIQYVVRYTEAESVAPSRAVQQTNSLRRRTQARRKYRLYLMPLLCWMSLTQAQVVYDNFEGNKVVSYVDKSGVLDTAVANPGPNAVNESSKCALYVRNSTKKFDNIKMKLYANLADVSPYTTYEGIPPRLKMKIYTAAPPGTLVEILLGSNRGNNAYPAGTNSQYQAYTTVSNQWEELEFKFSQVPEGSETSATQVDQVTLLFNPNSNTSDKFYFDEITGPGLVSWPPEKIASPEEPPRKSSKQKVKTSKKVTNK